MNDIPTDTPPSATPVSFHMSLAARLRAYLFAGILITAPIAITVYIAWITVTFVDERVTRLLPAAYNPNNYLPFTIPGLGLVLVIVLILLLMGRL